MADLDDILQKAKALAGLAVDASVELYKSAEEKTRLFARSTKLKTEIALDRKEQKKVYTEIGRLYYELSKDAPNPDFEQLFAEVETAQAAIDAKTAELEELKASAKESDIEIEIEICDDDLDEDSVEPEQPAEPEQPSNDEF